MADTKAEEDCFKEFEEHNHGFRNKKSDSQSE
jgi:hypothetical protein